MCSGTGYEFSNASTEPVISLRNESVLQQEEQEL